MPSFKDITVVSIHGNDKIENAIPAVEKTASFLPGCKKLLITNRFIDSKIEQKLLHQNLDYPGYSHFIIYSLFQYIETDYVLIVQDDGWALNGDNWNDEWFQYDYIGALTHAGLFDNKIYNNYSWKEHNNTIVCQNGGFSFRSKKLLEAPSKFGIMMHSKNEIELNAEDVQLCFFMRPALEKIGIKFAPPEHAKIFAFEHLDYEIHKDIDLFKVFGCHSKFRKLVSNDTIIFNIKQEMCKDIPYEEYILYLLNHYKYNIIWNS
jgi:hypothetical protein